MARSLITAGTIARLTNTIVPNIFETQLALNNGGVDLYLARWNATANAYETIGPQKVVLSYAARQEQTGGGESAAITTIGGEMTFLAPDDNVLPEDLFTLDGEDGALAGRVISVGPLKLGRRKATWELRVGGV